MRGVVVVKWKCGLGHGPARPDPTTTAQPAHHPPERKTTTLTTMSRLTGTAGTAAGAKVGRTRSGVAGPGANKA